MTPPDATIVIATKNRKDELRTALQSAVVQSGAPEILVIDDGSTDGTVDMVRAEFPSVRVVRHEESRGYIVRRNEGVTHATGAIVVSIDDDAAFSSRDVVRQTLSDFDRERIGAVAIPYIDVNIDPRVRQRAPDATGVYATGRYIGTAHAIRRDVFMRVGGYREELTHQGEEGDFCIRMLQAGHIVRLGTSDPIHHFESPKRDRSRMDYFGVRNAVRFVWQNVPQPFVLVHLPVLAARLLLLTFDPPRLRTRIAGLRDGFLGCAPSARSPVSRRTYLTWRRLERAPLRIDQLNDA